MSTVTNPNQTHVTSFDAERIRADFPLLNQKIYGKSLVYLDNAATTQKPHTVIQAISDYYLLDNANIHRGVHNLSQRATEAYEKTRKQVQRFINAPVMQEIVFTRGTTEAINLVAHSYGLTVLKPGDVVMLSEMEHHSNIVPWQLVCNRSGATIQVIPMDDRGELELDRYEAMLNEWGERCKIVALTHISNALGTINPLKSIIDMAHAKGAVVVIDGAQAASHTAIDVQALDCDFYAFSGHKLFAPTGTGVLYGKEHLLELMPPYQGGGEMIKMVSFAKTIYHDLPHKFEAGTPNIEGVVGLGAALQYLQNIGIDAIKDYENNLLDYATASILELPKVRLIGTARHKASILSFTYEGVHPHDIGTILDTEGIAVRSGHHCAMPTMEHFGIPATVRASFAFYNTKADVDRLVKGLHKVQEVLGV